MRLLFFGDIMGRAGRQALIAALPRLKEALKIDVTVANCENAAHGFGVTPKICADLYAAGVNILTTGNHVWDCRDIIPYIEADPHLLRPGNFPIGTPGRGVVEFSLQDGRIVVVMQFMARLFMDALDDPFARAQEELSRYRLGHTAAAIFVDFHGEATSEKNAFACYLDGRVSAVIGTHVHIPTADGRILPGGTAYQTDVGMCGDYDSIIGMDKAESVARFVRKMRGARFQVANGEATLCAVLIDINDQTGLADRIEPIRLGGCLPHSVPKALDGINWD